MRPPSPRPRTSIPSVSAGRQWRELMLISETGGGGGNGGRTIRRP